ncbi:histidinol-phosphate transaminase [bacterium]|nr:histidinol-phosphate transaminase [bacterium]
MKGKEHIYKIAPYEPGKPIEEVKRELGLSDVIKMASNENPLGPSPLALQAIREHLEEISYYPDGNCTILRQKLSEKLGFPPNCFVFGSGVDEIIHFLGLAFLDEGDEALTVEPSFVRYDASALLNKAIIRKVPLKDYQYDVDALISAINERTKLLFIANPNNPTGTFIDKEGLKRLLEKAKGKLVVLDEAYVEFVEDTTFPDSLLFLREGYDIIVLRTFSKIYGLAGLRIGYGIANEETVKAIEHIREPFNVNHLAQVAAVAALDDDEHIRKTQQVVWEGKRYLYEQFKEMGLRYIPSQTNFILVDVGKDSREVFRSLLREGVIVRTGDIFGCPNFLRVTIGTEKQNERFIRALKKVLGGAL